MTNRNSPPSMTRGIKKPRLRRVEIKFQGTPEPVHNGLRPHGGYRGSRPCPLGQYSHDKNGGYQEEIQDELRHLIDQEQLEKNGGSPFWVTEVHKESTHSGESPLFLHKLLASGKFEQEHGHLKFERALLGSSHKRLWSAPSRRRDQKQFFRENRTHQYLSATDLRKIGDVDECVIKYGRPTRTTLLRAMQRSNSAPVNAYDIRRENMRRVEDLRNTSIFYTSKELFDREHTRISYRFYNIYSTDGETMHSFLTGARYNRAHLLDSRGLQVYGVYMPRENPSGCFMAGVNRIKDPGDEIPSAPPDSPRSEFDDSPSPELNSRPDSSKIFSSRPTSSSRATTRTPSSRPQSHRQLPGSRPRSGALEQTLHIHSPRLNPKSADSNRRLPDEVTMHIPDHINPKGKSGVYVTLKGPKVIDAVESKLPRVTGISLPKLRKRHDAVEETVFVNQPPPTPVDVSLGSVDRNRFEALHGEQIQHIEPIINEEIQHETIDLHDNVPNKINAKASDHYKEVKFADRVANIDINGQMNVEDIKAKQETEEPSKNEIDVVNANIEQKNEAMTQSEVSEVVVETQIKSESVTEVKEPEVKVPADDKNRTVLQEPIGEKVSIRPGQVMPAEQISAVSEETVTKDNVSDDTDKVVFFMTEDGGEKTPTGLIVDNGDSTSEDSGEEEVVTPDNNGTVENVIRVEVSETEKKESNEVVNEHEPDKAITSEDFPFTDASKTE